MTGQLMHPELLKLATAIENANSIWLTSSISLSRNLEKFNFPSKLESDKKQQVIQLINEKITALPSLVHPFLIRAHDASPVDKEFLFEHFLTPEIFAHAHSGEAFVCDQTGKFLCLINLTDHLELMALDEKGDLEGVLNHLFSVETELGKSLKYAFNDKYGFLTSDPGRCGTGLNVRIFLQLPGLKHLNRLDDVLNKHLSEGIAFEGLQGSARSLVGDLFIISNSYTLGLNEEKIISMIRTFATHLMVEEKSARKEILDSDHPGIKDKVSRAYGLLMHSYQEEAVEALNYISLLKLGLELGWLTGASIKELNRLFFACRRAHLFAHFGDEIASQELLHRRAEFLHDTLKKLKLEI